LLVTWNLLLLKSRPFASTDNKVLDLVLSLDE
jgi:hypothetical protein